MDLLFDLDGTLTDSRVGIARCLQHALAELGREIPAESQLTRCIGPPLAHSLEVLLQSADPVVIERGVAAYRSRFARIGIFESTLYQGVPRALSTLAGDGHTLHVVTAKPSVYARRILEHFELHRFFASVAGPELADRHLTKEELVRDTIWRNRVAPRAAIMIGDRAEDVIAARRNNVRSIGVSWGYGGREELADALPDCILSSWPELVAYIQGQGVE